MVHTTNADDTIINWDTLLHLYLNYIKISFTLHSKVSIVAG